MGKLHYIFLSSSTVVEYFRNKFLQFGHKINNIPALINTGYLKLDKVMSELNKIKNTKSHILLAPTFSVQMKNYNMSDKLDIIIDNILHTGEKIIFRPHPLDLTPRGKHKDIKKIVELRSEYGKLSQKDFIKKLELDDNIKISVGTLKKMIDNKY